ncbi:hypothetical protein L2E82_14721 [Cichorium intybus]|uniref:Uncharacterized protein n=1 Tax=Cichorium intybus TaxID=13427 RepID=A0ACB9F059_CICIN|nr:hypothetical protein L2E82_14721 [Cichorium intybus]
MNIGIEEEVEKSTIEGANNNAGSSRVNNPNSDALNNVTALPIEIMRQIAAQVLETTTVPTVPVAVGGVVAFHDPLFASKR